MNFLYWLTNKASMQQKQEWSNECMNARSKQTLLMRWLVYRTQNCQIDIEVKFTSGVQAIVGKERLSKWLAQEQVDKKLGPLKAKHWRDSGLLTTRLVLLTGSSLPHMLRVPHLLDDRQGKAEGIL